MNRAHQEFLKNMNGFQGVPPKPKILAAKPIEPVPDDVPERFDWRSKGAVTHVKEQGQCGACWAFSTTGSLEAQIFKRTGKLVPLSEQNLIDCSKTHGNFGCYGGWMKNAFQYIQENGIETGEAYPYEQKDGVCRYNSSNIGAIITGYESVTKDERELKRAVATIGPISIAINDSPLSFQSYEH
ncbi:unnamed protein product, partial [Darwinula stevensoni]